MNCQLYHELKSSHKQSRHLSGVSFHVRPVPSSHLIGYPAQTANTIYLSNKAFIKWHATNEPSVWNGDCLDAPGEETVRARPSILSAFGDVEAVANTDALCQSVDADVSG